MIIFTQNQPITFEHIDAVKEMADKIKRVRELHKPSDIIVRWKDMPPAPDCDHCEHRYPCPTIEALDGEQ